MDEQQIEESLTNHNIDMLLNLIAKNDCLVESSEFPMKYDYAQPAKSWWRYFKKQTEQNTAMCYTCGAIFNRGPKQSTTSLSHHLKMYHREQFILIQQAKDADLHYIANNGRARSSIKRQHDDLSSQENGEYVGRKKSAFNIALISAVRKSEVYAKGPSDDKQIELWEKVAVEIGVTAQIAKKSWQSLVQRYRKEVKIAVRDNFLYKPKWPYFWDLNFLDEHSKTSQSVRKSSNSSTNSGDNVQNLGYLNGSGFASNLLNNILNVACSKSSVDEEENGSTDSAFASTSEHSGNDQEQEQNDAEKQDPTFVTIQQLFSAATSDPTTELPAIKRSRSRKTKPERLFPKLENSFDWLQDEDELFGKIIALRLRNLGTDKKRQMKILIEQLFERHLE